MTADHQPSLPLDPHEGLAPVAVTGEFEIAGLVHDALPRTVARIAIPAVASSFLMTLFTSVDTYWVGTRVGADGLAAVSTAVFWIWMIISIAEMVSVGLTAVAARRYGERRRDEAARTAGDALVMSLALGLLIAVTGSLLVERCFALMETPAAVTAMGTSYLHTYFLGTPLIYGFFAIDAAFRAAGDTKTPFWILASSVAITLVLDPALILGLWGMPKLGITGAALATALTRGGAFLIGLVIAVRRRILHVGAPRLAPIAAIARVGLPTAATGAFFSLIYVALTRTTTHFGTPALAALGIGHRVESWLYMLGVGFGAATAAIVGQNLGAGRPDRAARAGWIAVAFCSVFGAIACILELVMPQQFAGLFSTDPAVIAVSAGYLRIAAWSQLVICAEIVLEGALGGAGDTLPPMLTSSGITISRIPLAAWAAAQFGVQGIWWVISGTAILRGLAMMWLWRRGGWARKSV